MKCHIGVDADSGLVHTVVGTSANVHGVTQARALLAARKRSCSAMQATRVLTNARKCTT